MEAEHHLKMTSWDFVLGTQKVKLDNEVKINNVCQSIFPPKVVLNYNLLPPLDMSLAQANAMIMKNSLAKPAIQYINLWKKCKADGFIPIQEVSYILVYSY